DDAADWARRRPELLKHVRDSLGELPPRPNPPVARVVCREIHPDHVREKIVLDDGAEGSVSALLLVPDGPARKRPAILWLHSSSTDHLHPLKPGANGGEVPLAEEFLKAGYVVFAPDNWWHGDRAGTGPAGPAETGRAEQESLHKFFL